ncbi:hypothetical protein AWB73_06845 [Caballeronia turbans]|nr:hypothetical protein AWB73_06845 [Caballeronia turbans]
MARCSARADRGSGSLTGKPFDESRDVKAGFRRGPPTDGADMFLCYLIDPDRWSITKVNDGFDRASELTGSEHPGLAELWTDFADSTLDVAYSPDADEQPSFRVRLSFRGKTIDQAISGKGVLIACGEIPPEIAQQIQTAKAVQKMVAFSPASYIAVDRWLKGGLSVTRAPARRAESNGRLRLQEDRDKASGKR